MKNFKLKKLYRFTANWLAPGICCACGCEILIYNLVKLRITNALVGLVIAAVSLANLYLAWRKGEGSS